VQRLEYPLNELSAYLGYPRRAVDLVLLGWAKEGAMMDKLDEARSQETPVCSKKRTSARHVLRISLGAAISFDHNNRTGLRAWRDQFPELGRPYRGD
jgi:hypothetical protein